MCFDLILNMLLSAAVIQFVRKNKLQKCKDHTHTKTCVLIAMDLHLVAVAFLVFRCRRYSRTGKMT